MLAPDHHLVPSLRSDSEKNSIDSFLEKSKLKSSETKTAGQKTVDGAWTGAYVLHPITNEKIPVWIADYVLKDYGTGAIMAVPGMMIVTTLLLHIIIYLS